VDDGEEEGEAALVPGEVDVSRVGEGEEEGDGCAVEEGEGEENGALDDCVFALEEGADCEGLA